MLRIDLHVPDDEYETVRKLGAHWDAAAQIWYIDGSFDPAPFMHWLPFYNLHADFWYLAQTRTACSGCHEHTTVTAFLLPAGHKMLEVSHEDKFDTQCAPLKQNSPAFPFYLVDIPTIVRNVLSGFHHTLRKTVSSRLNRSHWINHCEHCGAQQDDTNLFAEIGGAFFPTTKKQAAAIQLHRIDLPFLGYCEDISHQLRLHTGLENMPPSTDKSKAYTAGDWFECMTQVVNIPSKYPH
ncbi:DNA primase [Xenorhabdus stockiae]|uniref:DNA primase n=1 Tax=Xenorhabdus stockiae TaxID=351614 RepID=A0A2D0KL99_9GAMM|nr:DUF5710 domain-containing protein [Xenorhabdus stockiae]PHM64158.1 DNA primase [Xenorhabdus stockiae]